MLTPEQIPIFLSMLLMQLPTLIVSFAACCLILTKRKLASRGSTWALLGFGLVLLSSILAPLTQTIIQGWVFENGQRTDRIWALTTASIFWAVLHAVAYVFLLVAVFAGRSTPDSINPPSWPSRTSWHLVVVIIMGFNWGLDYLPSFAQDGFRALTWLPLLGFLSPVLWKSPPRLWRRIAMGLCIFEVCLSPLLWFGSMLSFMDPLGFKVRVLGIPLFTIWSSAGQFLYLGTRGCLFALAAILIFNAPQIVPDEKTAA